MLAKAAATAVVMTTTAVTTEATPPTLPHMTHGTLVPRNTVENND